MRCFSWLALACTASLVLFGCDDSEGDDGSSGEAASECAASDSPAHLQIENQTSNTMAEITMRACDGSDLVMFPLPDGLAPGSETTIDLPAPGCWILSYAGEGCFNDPKHQTPIEGVCGGDTHVWQAASTTHTCAGAGW